MRTAIALFIALSACVPVAEQPGNAPNLKSCGAEAWEDAVGQPISLLETMRLVGPVRVLPVGSVMTLDHRPDRLNFDVDADDLISRVWCG